MLSVPQEVRNAAIDIDSREDISFDPVVDQPRDASVFEHAATKVAEPQPTCEPPRRRDHENITRIHINRLLNEFMIERLRTCVPVAINLVGRIPDNHVELHITHLLNRVRPVDEGVGVVLAVLGSL